MDSEGNVPVFGFPVGPHVHLRDKYFFGYFWPAGEEYFSKEVLVEAGEGFGGVTIWFARGGTELETESDDRFEGFRDVSSGFS